MGAVKNWPRFCVDMPDQIRHRTSCPERVVMSDNSETFPVLPRHRQCRPGRAL